MRSGQQPQIVVQRLERVYGNAFEIWMRRIQQPVALVRREGRRHEQRSTLRALYEFIANRCQFRRSWSLTPTRRKLFCADFSTRNIVWNLGSHQNQIRRRVIRREVDEIFQHRQRLML